MLVKSIIINYTYHNTTISVTASYNICKVICSKFRMLSEYQRMLLFFND